MFCSRCISREGQFVLSICSLLLISIACSFSFLTFQFSNISFFFLLYPPLRVQKETFEPRVRSTSLNYEDAYLIPRLCFAPFNSVCSRYALFTPSYLHIKVHAAKNPAATWSCTVPDGYTYDQVIQVTNTCGAGSNPYYHIFLPTGNQWACLQVLGHIYDRVNTSTACSPIGVPTIRYRLRKPVDSLMACGPGTWNGFVYDFHHQQLCVRPQDLERCIILKLQLTTFGHAPSSSASYTTSSSWIQSARLAAHRA